MAGLSASVEARSSCREFFEAPRNATILTSIRRAASPPLSHRRHRRSYTISTPLEARLSAYPSAFQPIPARKPTPGPGREDKENQPPVPHVSATSLPREDGDPGATVKKAGSADIPSRPRIFHTTSIHNDRFLDLPPLPAAWETHHDRAICLLDSRNYSHSAIVVKLRRCFPELRGVLTPLMIDKRLRILDQNVDLDYWRTGLNAKTTPRPTEVVDDDTPKKRKRAKVCQISSVLLPTPC